MNQNGHAEETKDCRLGEARKAVDPCSIVIFGASGDLTSRKLIPAFYHIYKEGQMPPAFRIIGFARREKTDDSWRQELRQALEFLKGHALAELAHVVLNSNEFVYIN